jgi:hypothetical protein
VSRAAVPQAGANTISGNVAPSAKAGIVIAGLWKLAGAGSERGAEGRTDARAPDEAEGQPEQELAWQAVARNAC